MPIALTPPCAEDHLEPAPHRKRFTRRDCEFLAQNEILTGRYELIDGEILSKMGQKPAHTFVTMRLMAWLMLVFGGSRVSCQGPIEVGESENEINEPEPDIAVLAEPSTTYDDRHPGPDDVLLVVEVSDTTLKFDLGNKARLYARAGIGEYWVADIAGRRIVVHRQPKPEGYAEVLEYRAEERISPPTKPEADTLVADLLPPLT